MKDRMGAWTEDGRSDGTGEGVGWEVGIGNRTGLGWEARWDVMGDETEFGTG